MPGGISILRSIQGVCGMTGISTGGKNSVLKLPLSRLLHVNASFATTLSGAIASFLWVTRSRNGALDVHICAPRHNIQLVQKAVDSVIMWVILQADCQ